MTDNPKTWGEMTPEEKGALLLAQHEGKVIECWQWYDGPWVAGEWGFDDRSAYRIKPEPKRATVTLRTAAFFGWVAEPAHFRRVRDTHRITFDTVDGEPVCDSIRMEKFK